MKYWLIAMIFDYQGQWVGKVVQPHPSKVACEQAIRVTIGDPKIRMRCVSDDHWSGRKQDPGVAYD